ncbi:FixH family protein [Paraflavitalea sp. CAU 1676]|uniref:FixH family protein n=1 Tax=Paraflavitalea sp. CAU 1676 TaxID=3032598 RepID=UPI0023D9D75E|nr:FixH family protein [Paraflavitalea sp. CAU 1676]MDF2192386.1 FixH family protein [Paraflavitalea sp. CAU 1676]
MNWGNKLILVFVAFGGFMSFMVYRCMQAPVNLVAKEYYRDELAYQQVINGRTAANALGGHVRVQQSSDSILIQLPAAMQQQTVQGSVVFYCAADSRRDRRFDLAVNNDALQVLSRDSLLPGRYVVKVSWKAGTEQFYAEEPFAFQ